MKIKASIGESERGKETRKHTQKVKHHPHGFGKYRYLLETVSHSLNNFHLMAVLTTADVEKAVISIFVCKSIVNDAF